MGREVKEIKVERIDTLHGIADYVRSKTDNRLSPSLSEVFQAIKGGSKGRETKIRKIVEKDPLRAKG